LSGGIRGSPLYNFRKQPLAFRVSQVRREFEFFSVEPHEQPATAAAPNFIGQSQIEAKYSDFECSPNNAMLG